MNKENVLSDWPMVQEGYFKGKLYICTKEKPMPLELKDEGRWEHDDVRETDYDGDYSIEYKCHSCGHIWRREAM